MCEGTMGCSSRASSFGLLGLSASRRLDPKHWKQPICREIRFELKGRTTPKDRIFVLRRPYTTTPGRLRRQIDSVHQSGLLVDWRRSIIDKKPIFMSGLRDQAKSNARQQKWKKWRERRLHMRNLVQESINIFSLGENFRFAPIIYIFFNLPSLL